MANKEKHYTAQEMRNFADAIAGDLNDSGHTSVLYSYHDLIPVIESLRQAADSLEREEKLEKKYEYSEKYSDGEISPFHDTERIDFKYTLKGSVVVRREVGEWEEVCDGE